MKDNVIIIVTVATCDLREHLEPLLRLIREKKQQFKIIGVFVSFADFNISSFGENLLDEFHFTCGHDQATELLSRFIGSEFVFLINHTASLADYQLYRISSSIPKDNLKLVLRNIINLERFLDVGQDDSKHITLDIKRAEREYKEIRLKVFLFSTVVAALVLFARPISRILSTKRPKNKKILFFKLDVLGDMIVTIPYIRALRESFPQAEITIMASTHGAGFLKGQHQLHPLGLYDHLLVWDAPWHFPTKSILGLPELKDILRWLPIFWKERFDIVIQPVVFGTGLAFALLTLGKRIIASVDSGLPLARALRPLITDPVDIKKDRIYHMKDYAEETLKALNVERKFDTYCDLKIDTDASATVKLFLNSNGHFEELLVIVNVGARNPVRIWSTEKFSQVIKTIKTNFQATVVLIGTEHERVLAESISVLSGVSIINAAGQLSFNELTDLVARSSLVITSDTGIMHLAAAVKVPIVAIFGAGLVDSCHPLNDDFIIVKKEFGCSGCADRCFASPPAPCMDAIMPEDVFDAVNTILSQSHSEMRQKEHITGKTDD